MVLSKLDSLDRTHSSMRSNGQIEIRVDARPRLSVLGTLHKEGIEGHLPPSDVLGVIARLLQPDCLTERQTDRRC
jgi:hypothetical protein